MDTIFFEYISTQGVFAVLFSALLIYVLRGNKSREDNYYELNKQIDETLLRIEELLEELLRR